MDTSPAPLETTEAGSLVDTDDFRLTSAGEITRLLRELRDGNVPLSLVASGGIVYKSSLWAVNAERGTIGFCADLADSQMHALLTREDVTVVGYLDSVKLQFDVTGMVLVQGNRTRVLAGAMPREMLRFQRRDAFRVRPLMRSAPTARLAHAQVGGVELALRIVDVSIGGCALFLPDELPAFEPGLVLERVEVDLDADTRFRTTMRLHHVTRAPAQARGLRLGFEFVYVSGDALRSLQRFIDHTQKRGKLLAFEQQRQALGPAQEAPAQRPTEGGNPQSVG
jgi:c-di-GMP-binding flagellar brake protein YcgR